MLRINLHTHTKKTCLGLILTLTLVSMCCRLLSAQVPVVWPLQDGSHEMLTGFCDGMDYNPPRFHSGIDLAGAGKVIVAARSGIIRLKGPAFMGHQVVIEVNLGDGNVVYDAYGHLDPRSITKEEDEVIAMGDAIGKIGTDYKPRSENHCHFVVLNSFDSEDMYGVAWGYKNVLNPFSIFPENKDQDPQEALPILKNVFFTSDGTRYVDSSKPLYGPIDIIVEAYDEMSSTFSHYQGVHRIGYWIENLIGGGADVASDASPYILCTFDDDWFSGLEIWTSTDSKFENVFDTNFLAEADPQGLHRYHHYIVTNTESTDGNIRNVDWDQLWRTNVHKDACVPTNLNRNYINDNCTDYLGHPYIAEINDYARFKDGTYTIHIVLEDMIHAEYRDETKADATNVVVDNFLPYVKEVEVTQEGDIIYHAGWIMEARDGENRLFWGYYSLPQRPIQGKQAEFRLVASEAMQELSLDLPGQSLPLSSSDGSDDMEWRGTTSLPSEAGETYPLRIMGRDLAGNEILAFGANISERIPKRTGKAFPEPEWVPMHMLGTDTIHRLGPDLIHPAFIVPCDEPGDDGRCLTDISDPFNPLTWTLTTPTESTCDEDFTTGGVICTFGASEERARQGSVALLPNGVGPNPGDFASRTPYVWLSETDQSGRTHEGTHRIPHEGLSLQFIPPAEWVGACLPETQENARCPGSDPDAPGHKDPSPDSQDTVTLDWRMTSESLPATDRCRVTMTWNEKSPVIVEIQPQTLCDALPAEDAGTLEVTATCTWEPAQVLDYDWKELEPENRETTRWVGPIKRYDNCTGKDGCYQGCQENPAWRQSPPPPLDLTTVPPGDPNFSPEQLVQVTYSNCQWSEQTCYWGCQRVMVGCPTYTCACLDTSRCFIQQVGGNLCDAVETHRRWQGVSNCLYKSIAGQLAFPQEPLTVTLTP